MLIVLTGKSNSGKDTIAKELQNRGINRILSYTTRPMRPTENGTEYHFISQKLMGKMIREMKFLSVKIQRFLFSLTPHIAKQKNITASSPRNREISGAFLT